MRCANSPKRWNSRPRASTARPPKPRTTTRCAICSRDSPRPKTATRSSRRSSARRSRPSARAAEDETARRMFVLQYVQPGLAGLMDGSVSTLAPLFAAAFATHNTWADIFGRACGLDRRRHLDGLRRGFVGRRLAHRARRAGGPRRGLRPDDDGRRARPCAALPHPAFLRGDRAGLRGGRVELAAISWIRTRYMDTPFLQAAFQVVVGGALVFAAGILIGSS